MADAPRSILAWLGGQHQGLSFAGGPSGEEIEYIRADVARADALAEVQRLRDERDRFEAALGRACLVGGTTYLLERADTAVADRDRLAAANVALEAKLARLVETVERAIKDTMLRLGKHPDIRRIMAPQVMWGAGDSCISAIRAALSHNGRGE